MRPSFMAVIKTHHGLLGTDMRLIVRYQLSPEGQRDLFNKAIVGYDVHHPDSAAFDGLKFMAPTPPPKPPETPKDVKEPDKSDPGQTDQDWTGYCG